MNYNIITMLTLNLAIHSSLERDVTAVAILSHLCGVVEGYVRNACSNNYTKYDNYIYNE